MMEAKNLYFNVTVISRGAGRSAPAAASYRSGSVVRRAGTSAVASASYRSGEVLYDEQLNKTYDYTRKEDVLHAEIIAPERAPAWVQDRSTLWNTVEAVELKKRSDAQFARDAILALPRGLDTETYVAMVREFVQENFVKHGMIADFALHDKQASDGGRNPHAHIMLTMRDVDKDGFNAKKNRSWNRKALLKQWRAAAEELGNHYLEEAGLDYRISYQSYASRGIDKTPGEHLGPFVWGLEEKGVETQQGDRNRKVANDNQKREISKAHAEILEPESAPEGMRKDVSDLREVSNRLGETWDDTPDQQEEGQVLPFPHTTDGAAGNVRQQIEAEQRTIVEATMQQTKRIGTAFAAQVKHYAGLMKEKAVALGLDESSALFGRFKHLRDVSQEQRKRGPDHER